MDAASDEFAVGKNASLRTSRKFQLARAVIFYAILAICILVCCLCGCLLPLVASMTVDLCVAGTFFNFSTQIASSQWGNQRNSGRSLSQFVFRRHSPVPVILRQQPIPAHNGHANMAHEV